MELPERESMDFDVVVVGAGPAGLATAMRYFLYGLLAVGAAVCAVLIYQGS